MPNLEDAGPLSTEELVDDEEDSDLDDEDEDVDDSEGGSGADEDDEESEEDEDSEESPEASHQPALTGQALLDLLAGNTEAQGLLSQTLQSMMAESARTAAAQAEAAELQQLIKDEKYDEVGKRIVERTQMDAARAQVEDTVLKQQFAPVYQDIFAQPELKVLTAEEREKLHPSKYNSDAEYVRGLTSFIEGKRFESKVQAEVTKRVEAELKARANGESSARSKTRSVAAGPGATAELAGARQSTTDLIRQGLRATFEPGQHDDDE